jgi:uncharacterized protein (DUF2237 family)
MDGKIISFQERPEDWRADYRYAVYEHKLVFDVSRAYTRSFIVVKNKYGVIVHFTCFHNYIDAYAKGVCIPLAIDAKTKLHFVCAMLNYILIENHKTFGIGHVFSIEKDMLDTFFQDYALTKQPNGRYRSNQTVEKCVSAVTGFFRKLSHSFDGYMKISTKDLSAKKLCLQSVAGWKKSLCQASRCAQPCPGRPYSGIFRQKHSR